MRQRRWIWSAAAVLLTCTAALVWKVVGEDYGPFDGWINFHSTQLLDRASLGYQRLPAYHAYVDRPGGYFDFYTNTWGNKDGIGTCVYEEPWWPDGDPGRGADDPLPPLVRRHTIRAYAPRVPATTLALGWVAWGCWVARWVSRRPPTGPGFPVGGHDAEQA